MMRSIVALILAASTIAACGSLAPAGPDSSRPSLFGSPFQPAAASPAPAGPAAAGAGSAGQAVQDAWASSVQMERGYLQPYPAQQQVLDRQRGLLGQDIRQQDSNRVSLQQQLQQGTLSDQQDALRVQQQLEQQRRGW